MSNTSRTCRWILIPGFMEGGPKWCEKPVKWTMQPSGGEPGAELVREYKSFCPEHEAKAEAQISQKDIDDDDDF
jgi:hypothetical protein